MRTESTNKEYTPITTDPFISHPRIETPRLILRAIVPEDAPAIYATCSDPEVMAYYGEERHASVADSLALIEHQQEWYRARAGIRWGITRRGEDVVLGSCGIFHFDETRTRAVLGYELGRASWRQGIMSEALTGLLTFAFGEMGLERIEAVVNEGNEASMGLLRSLGFTHEGTLRKRFVFAGRVWDEEYFGLLRDEWPQMNGLRGKPVS